MSKKYFALALATLAACQSSPSQSDSATQAPPAAGTGFYHEAHRPQFHFSPK